MHSTIDALFVLAQATQPAQQAPPWAQFLSSPMFLIAMLMLVFYVFVFRSKKNQDRQRQTMLSQMKRGDRIQTIGGILGNVVDVRDDRVQVKIDESANVKVWFSRSAIHRVVEDDKAEAK
ncbi:MAG: preprotein translocase subunit YajC [Tepidisphaeraceae bacterium]